MARSNQSKTVRILDASGVARTGQSVELKRGAMTITMTEDGNGYYSNSSVPVGQWAVYVGAVDTGETVAVGAGEVDVPDYTNNPDSTYVTDSSGVPQLNGPNTVVTSLTIDGVANTTGDIDTDAVYLRNSGTPTAGNLPVWNADTQQLDDSGIDASGLVSTISFTAGNLPAFDSNGDLVDSTIIAVTPVESKTASFTASKWYHYNISDASGDVLVTLPSPSSVFKISFRKTNSSINKITFSEDINGDSTFAISSQNSFLTLFSDGTEYVIF